MRGEPGGAAVSYELVGPTPIRTSCILAHNDRYGTYEESAMDADDDRAVMTLRKCLGYEDVRRDRMPVDYAIYFSQNVKSILNRGAGHNRLVKGYGRGRAVRERVTANVRVIDSICFIVLRGQALKSRAIDTAPLTQQRVFWSSLLFHASLL